MEVTQKIAQYISDSSDEEVQTDNNDMQRNKKIKKRQIRYCAKEAEICIQNDVSKQYYIPARNLESISQIDLKKYIKKTGQPSISSRSRMIFGVWRCRMILIGKRQNVIVQLFLKITYASISLEWLSD